MRETRKSEKLSIAKPVIASVILIIIEFTKLLSDVKIGFLISSCRSLAIGHGSNHPLAH
jgi:hypothetical protein